MSPSEPVSLPDEAQAEAEGPFRLHFRVLSIGGARKAFRLETVFWEALEALAKRNGRTLAAEVEARLVEAPDHLNQSSALRANLAAELLALWRRAENRALRPEWSAMVAAVPAPAFVISRRSVLLSANEPLLTYLQSQRLDRGVPLNTLQGAMELTVQAPPSAIAEFAGRSERKFVSCNVVFAFGHHRISCRTRLLPVEGPTPEAAALLGFLETTQA